MSDKKIKFFATVIAYCIITTGCKADIDEVINVVKPSLDNENLFPPSTTEFVEPQETQSTEPKLKPRTDIAIVKSDVNMYYGNTDSALILGQIPSGSKVQRVFNAGEGWDLVRYDNKIGYVQNLYLDYLGETIESEVIHSQLNDIVLTTASFLNFRNGPNVDSEIIGGFDYHTELQVLAEVDNGWLLVKYNGVVGYVHGNYTQSLLEKAQNEYPFLELTELKVKKIGYSTATLNFRQGNSTDTEIIGEFSKYETVRILGEYEGWYFVMTNDYHFGFVSKDYTSELTESFVVVDVSKQQLFLYYNNELYYTTPVVTGKDSTPSDIGLFAIQYKCRNAILMNDTPVEYWMKYNNSGEGLHDADWRSQFGTDAYHYAGSHGCVNIPPEITDEIYDNTTVGTKVIVHK